MDKMNNNEFELENQNTATVQGQFDTPVSPLQVRGEKIKNDFVQTPKIVTQILLQNEKFDGEIFEPCCGKGAISDVLKNEGYKVHSSDKNNYGYGSVRNLFDIHEKCENIITNPPFTQQQLVKKHLLSITKKKIALLWYVKNLGNEIETKSSAGLKSVYVINTKINWVETKLGWLFAWYVWEKGYDGNILIKRINFENNQETFVGAMEQSG